MLFFSTVITVNGTLWIDLQSILKGLLPDAANFSFVSVTTEEYSFAK